MSKPLKRKTYKPPIAWDRFSAMSKALYMAVYEKKPVSREMAAEIYDALLQLRNVYQEQLIRSFPNKRAKAEDLRAAAMMAATMSLLFMR